jgi:Ni,Fe-hydrogenase III small subunit
MEVRAGSQNCFPILQAITGGPPSPSDTVHAQEPDSQLEYALRPGSPGFLGETCQKSQ